MKNKYLLGTAYLRPLIAKRLVEIAKQEKSRMLFAMDVQGKRNDQVQVLN